jgi:hypothetical protein
VRERHGWWNEENKRAYGNVPILRVPSKTQVEAGAIFDDRIRHLEMESWIFKFRSVFDAQEGGFVPQGILTAPEALDELRSDLIPACPRDNSVMVYDGTYLCMTDIVRHPGRFERYLPSYRCGAEGCVVRYRHVQGYFTLEASAEFPTVKPVPGVNVVKCPEHGHWLYMRARSVGEKGASWCCAEEGCNHVQKASDIPEAWRR